MKLSKIFNFGKEKLLREVDFHAMRLTSATFEMTKVCNLRCHMCDFGRVRYTNKGELTLEEWLKVIDEIIPMGVRWCNFIGAEPLVRKDDVLAMASRMDGKNIRRQLNTNGTLLTEDLCRSIVQHFEYVIISIDGPKEMHNEIRGQKWAFEKSMEGIRMLLEARKQRGAGPSVTLHTTILNSNYNVINQMVDVVHQSGADAISFQYVSETPQKSVSESVFEGQIISSDRYVVGEGKSCLLSQQQIERLRSEMNEIQKDKTKHIMKGVIPFLSDESLKTGVFPVHRCYMSHNTAVISPEGEVHTCSHLNYPIGNVRKSGLSQIWKSERHQKLTKKLDEKLLPICDNCCHFSSNLTPVQIAQMLLRQKLR